MTSTKRLYYILVLLIGSSSSSVGAQFGGRRGCCVKADTYLNTLSASQEAIDSVSTGRPAPPCAQNEWHREWIANLDSSLERLSGRRLVRSLTECQALAENERLVCVSHDTTESGPIFNYATRAALDLWEMDWDEFVSTPSRQSAQEDAREERARLLDTVSRQGYIDNYSGIRISKSGRRFKISNVLVWNVDDTQGNRLGQAALFDRFQVKYL
uniref:MEKHLA domain-containing protein n=1 Tax=Aureoumbra lagunensis TaxID=44058 RepID=A0A7S3NP52_9STRA|mmetsp:Transcript_11327/g.15530  ORF Transcript_11327/g.15530 Transcript_11327/m.15530 type:complete len:213 (-) Transcript_11327:152-790(-)|eukprot:CAMPEP_0197293264 /NCGR_PEP_ID=MMETSP0890-20130614/27643_1 /TAXON_ID=44058 ORGANISM="Aureoumbra lagunensis, Strain CCMP1510" /NCGR_SAMPLE_ID=MMETSP0890 /ASSEMBLY_ACC=CAM_ASM_000533 /LENGTH=212 /DNA_ID=CAMNT_0042767851 /DNA_START=40 /DNA_END=678 /DNA_ORIENTATION=+